TMLGFVEDAKGKALIAEAREVYVAAQATATEFNDDIDTSFTAANLETAIESGAVKAEQVRVEGTPESDDTEAVLPGGSPTTKPQKASNQMYTYLAKDLTIATGTTKPANTSKDAYWVVSFTDVGNTAKVTSLEYSRNGYTVTIDKTSNGGASIVKY
ncbi:MAG: hypothetical protein CVV01_03360, partial [Firmicutes bacterium HGW-Firmicutes-6]